MKIKPRHTRLYTNPGTIESEENYHQSVLEWNMPVSQCALVSVDVWNFHFSRSTLERIELITSGKIAPLFETARQSGLLIIHAPGPDVAYKSPNWRPLIPADETPLPGPGNTPDWPPDNFKRKTGAFSRYARPCEPQEAERTLHRQSIRDFHPCAAPWKNEPVIANGDELHRICAEKQILFLFYAGFNTNACIVMRDYGMFEMKKRGYEIVLLRDCTTGMETAKTYADMICTRGQIATLEQFGFYTIESGELISGLTEQPARLIGCT